jgi:hypothetical protein
MVARTIVVAGSFAVVVAAVGGWLTHRALELKSELTAASLLLPEFKNQLLMKDESAAEDALQQLQTHTDAAQAAANDPLWKAAAAVPWIGPNFSAVSELALSAGDVVEGTAKPLLRVFRTIEYENLTPVGGKFDVAPLAVASPTIVAAANTVELTHSRLADLDSSRLFAEIAGPLNETLAALDELRATLNVAADGSRVLPSMLGSNGARNYLILVQNNAEIRATGGLPGALALLRVENGAIQLAAQSSGSALGKFTPPIDVDPAQSLIYTDRLGSFISDVNLTPDFPTAAQSAKQMWEKRFGSSIDGVVAIDPVVLSHILDASGPVEVPVPSGSTRAGGFPAALTADNVVQTLLSDVYRNVDGNNSQDAYFASASEQIFKALASGKAPGVKLVPALVKSAAENRVYVWSDHKTEQQVLKTLSIGGAASGPNVGGASFGVYFNDGTGAKMDYYVKRTVQLVQQCMSDGYGEVKVRITSTNTAPADAATSMPAYVTGGGIYGVPPGTVRTNVIAYGPVQSNVETASVDGHKVGFAAHHHANRPVGTVTVSLTPGQSSTVEMTFGKIVQHAEPNLLVTPTVQPVKDVALPTEPAECTGGNKAAG